MTCIVAVINSHICCAHRQIELKTQNGEFTDFFLLLYLYLFWMNIFIERERDYFELARFSLLFFCFFFRFLGKSNGCSSSKLWSSCRCKFIEESYERIWHGWRCNYWCYMPTIKWTKTSMWFKFRWFDWIQPNLILIDSQIFLFSAHRSFNVRTKPILERI